MKKRLRSGLQVLAILFPIACSAQNQLQLFHKDSSFTHKTWLRGSKHEDTRRVFTQTEKGVHISGDGFGYISSGVALRDYHLTIEFCWGDQKGLARGERKGKALDSGLFLHATGPHGNSHDGKGAFMAAIECNIMEGATGDILLIRGDDQDGKLIAPRATVHAGPKRDRDGFPYWQPNAATGEPVTLQRWGRINWPEKSPEWNDVRGFRGPRDKEKPVGQWNKLECICRGDTITIMLNGVAVNKVTKIWPTEGKILLQCEGAEIEFRNIFIKPLLKD